MKGTVQSVQKAIQLRRLGHSYSDIARELKVSRASVCNWVKNVRLTEHEKGILQKSLTAKMHRAHMKASISLRARKVFKEKQSFEEAEKNFKKNLKESLFAVGLGLYCSKGSLVGGNIQFIHTNEDFLRIILLWLHKYLEISKNEAKYRLFVDFSSPEGELEKKWAHVLGIYEGNIVKIITSKHPKKVKKPNDYKGSLGIVVSKIEAMRTIISWQKLLIKYYK